MGVNSELLLITEDSLNRLPTFLSDYLKPILNQRQFAGQSIYLACGIEMMEYLWDGLDLTDEEKMEIIHVVEKEDPLLLETRREDFDSDGEYYDACLDDFYVSYVQSYFEWIIEYKSLDCITMVSSFD